MARLFCLVVSIVLAGLCSAAPTPEEKTPAEIWGTPIDPDKDCAFRHDKGSLTIVVPGRDHDLGVERGKMNAPRVLRPTTGDFTVQVRIAGSFKPEDATTDERAAFQGAGLVLMKDERTYLRLERATFTRDGMKTVYTVWELRQDGAIDRFAQADDHPLDETKETFLKLQRRGNQFAGYVSQDRKEWHEMAAKTIELSEELRVGVAAINTAAQTFAPRFDEFKLTFDRDKRDSK